MTRPLYTDLLFAGNPVTGDQLFTVPANYLWVLRDIDVSAQVSLTPGYMELWDGAGALQPWLHLELCGAGLLGRDSQHWDGRQAFPAGSGPIFRTNIGPNFLWVRISGYRLSAT